MPKLCRVCYSKHRDEYEDMFLRGIPIIKIQQYALEKYNEKYSYTSMHRHLTKHVKAVVEARVKSEVAQDEYIKAQLEKGGEVAKRLINNLKICDERIRELLQSELSQEDKKILLQYLGEVRQTIELLLRYMDRIQLKREDENAIFNKILYCMQDFPVEFLEKFKKKWIEYELRHA